MSYDITRYQWLKEHGICAQCGQRNAFPGYVRCPECIEKVSAASAKCWSDKEKRMQYNRQGNKRKKQLREERKNKHLCVRCGKPLPEKYEYLTCVSCRKKRSEKRKTGTTYGEAFRARMGKGICMYCGAEVVAGYKLCERCLERVRESIKKSNQKASEKWRGEITRQWENAKLKSSRNG